MAILEILQYPDPRLRKIASKVENPLDPVIQKHVDDMFDTLRNHESPWALAATQVDIHLRIVVMFLEGKRSMDKPEECLTFINPEIVECSGSIMLSESCMSVPMSVDVERSNKVLIRALDRQGNPFEMTAEGPLAVCLQHELDHLVGKLNLDHLSRLKRVRFEKKVLDYLRRSSS